MQPSEHFALGSGVVRRWLRGLLRRHLKNGKTITVVAFGSVDAIGADEGSQVRLAPLDTLIALDFR
jgi:hypothetical protein